MRVVARRKIKRIVWYIAGICFGVVLLFGKTMKQEDVFTLIASDFGGYIQEKWIPLSTMALGEMREAGGLQATFTRLFPLYGYGQYKRETPVMGQITRDEQVVVGERTVAERQDSGELKNLLIQENEKARQKPLAEADAYTETPQQTQGSGTIPRTGEPVQRIDLEALEDYEQLIKDFYTIDPGTKAGKDLLEVHDLASRDMTLQGSGLGPHILIYHTHSKEAFADSIPGDRSTTIVGAGQWLADILTDTYGYQVLHYTEEFDAVRDDAYAASLPVIEQVLRDNPSIEVVIDLHRDEMKEGNRLVMDMDGRPTARFMFFNGLSRTKRNGEISYLYNENLGDNLAFSFQMQKKAMEYYPGITRKST